MWSNALCCQSAKVMRVGLITGFLVLLGVQTRAGSFILNVNTDLAAYDPGHQMTIYVDLTNSSAATFHGSVAVTASHLGYVCSNLPVQLLSSLAAHATTTKMFDWTPPANDFQGYLLTVSVLDGNSNIVDMGSSAVDVSSDWRRFPRYGYIAQYWYQLDAGSFTWQLKNYHINGLQFYDYQWKHHVPYNGGSTWKDVANRDIYRNTLTNLITAAHDYNMVAMAYNDWGSAYDNCLTDGSGVTLSMGRFSGAPASTNNQYTWGMPAGWATPQFRLMNPRDSGWQNYIYGRMEQSITNFGFDGWHVDNLVSSDSMYDFAGNQFNISDFMAQFLNNAKIALGKRITYNNVDGYALNQVAQSADVDFVYTELWDGHANYSDLQAIVDNVRRFGSKATVYAAYMNRGTSSANFNEASVRLADAAMFANGADHLELGDGDRMLNNEYFPDDSNVTMTSSLRSAMRSYYDFLVAYENLLRDDTISANNAATISGVTTSSNGAAGAVWVISKKSPGYNIIHLVNLLNNTSTAWRDTNGTYLTPPTQNNLSVKMYYTGAISGGKLWWASPDVNSCAASQLSYATGSDGGGNYITFVVPQLQYWDMIWLELNGTTSAANQIEAENYDSMAGISTETTTDTGGGLDVGSVNNISGDSYLVFNNVDFGTGPASVSARVASAVNNGAVEFRLDNPGGTLIATVQVGNTGGWQNWQTKSAAVSGVSGVHRLFVVFKNAASNLNWFNFNFSNFNNTLPSPWGTADIGSVGLTGGAAYNGGIYTLDGSGSDIEGTADAFRFVSQASGTNCEIRARVTSVQNTDPWAKGGVMIRDGTAADAANAAVVVTSGNGVAFQRRTSVGGGTTSTVISDENAPTWVRLTRLGNAVTGYYSLDGTNWIQIGAGQTVSLSASALIGLAVTAHNNVTTGVANFDHVSVNNAPMLTTISNRTLIGGTTLFITNSASDTDLPAQTLIYNLLDAPTGSMINTNTGVFSWRPTIAQSPSTQTVAVTVSDNGIPSMSATQSFSVTVNQPAQPVQNANMTSNGAFSLTVSGDAGPDYTVLGSTNLVNWQPLFLTNSPVMPFTWTDSPRNFYPARFYRIVLGP